MSINGIEHQKPVPEKWRTLLQDIVDAFVEGDFSLNRGVVGALPISSDLAARNAEYVSKYGETLTKLPDETWTTSFCVRYEPHWDILIDLWTQSEGPSDMVLAVQAIPVEGNEMPVFKVGIIYVP